MKTQSIQAVCASSTGVSRREIIFNPETGLIVKVEGCQLPKEKVDFYYGDECLLFAGMGDIHIHGREDVSGLNNYKEDFCSVSASAINGGVAHVADMPNNPIPPIDDQSYLQKMLLSDKSKIPILMYAGIGPHTKPLSFQVPYKIYMGPSIGDLYFKNRADVENVLQYYRGLAISFHCEDPEILNLHVKEQDHFKKRPLSAEISACDFALELISKYELQAKLCHFSSGLGLEAIRSFRQKGFKVSCEVTPQHLYFSEEDIKAMSAQDQILFQMNPPIRKKNDQNKLLEALINDEIDYLATDHAPHSLLEKKEGISGLTGLDTYAPFVTWLLLEKKVKPEIIAKITSEKPGLFFNQFLSSLNKKSDLYLKWGQGMGFLRPDFSASFTILNLKAPYTVKSSALKTKAGWNPFLNCTFPGSLEAIFIAGKEIKQM